MPALIMLEINGEMRSIPKPGNVQELLEYLAIGQDKVAVELNRRILRRKDWRSTHLEDRDKIEIVQFVGGG